MYWRTGLLLHHSYAIPLHSSRKDGTVYRYPVKTCFVRLNCSQHLAMKVRHHDNSQWLQLVKLEMIPQTQTNYNWEHIHCEFQGPCTPSTAVSEMPTLDTLWLLLWLHIAPYIQPILILQLYTPWARCEICGTFVRACIGPLYMTKSVFFCEFCLRLLDLRLPIEYQFNWYNNNNDQTIKNNVVHWRSAT